MPAPEAVAAIDTVKGFLPYIISAGAAGMVGYCATRIQEGQEGLIYHSGHVIREQTNPIVPLVFPWAIQGVPYGSVGPGIYWTFPGYRSIQKISTQNKRSPLTPFEHDVIEDDGYDRQRRIESFMVWGVVKRRDANKNRIDYPVSYTDLLIRAHCNFEPEELKETVASIGSDGLETVLEGKQDLRGFDKRQVAYDLVDVCGEQLFNLCGVEIRGWGLYSKGYTHADIMRDGLLKAHGKRKVAVEPTPGEAAAVQPDSIGEVGVADVYYLENHTTGENS